MPFEKGKPKTGGRQPGAPNKATGELRDQLQYIVETTMADLPALLETVDIAERIRLVTGLLPYVMPKLSTVDLNATIKTPSLERGATLEAWTAESLLAYREWQKLQELPSSESITPNEAVQLCRSGKENLRPEAHYPANLPPHLLNE